MHYPKKCNLNRKNTIYFHFVRIIAQIIHKATGEFNEVPLRLHFTAEEGAANGVLKLIILTVLPNLICGGIYCSQGHPFCIIGKVCI